MTDVCLLNTRALAQQQATYDVFKAAGFNVINFPCIAIEVTDKSELAQQQLASIQSNDTLIFTSQHAVHYAFKLYPNWQPQEQTIIAVGTKTAEILEQNTHHAIFVPKKQNSQGVIELLQGLKQCHSIHLITAPQGRKQIQNFALDNNIKLQQINVYQRTLPSVSPQALKKIEHCDSLYVLATSTTTLKNLKQLLTEQLWIKICHSTLICISARIENYAKQQGFKKCYNTNTANPTFIAEQLKGLVLK